MPPKIHPKIAAANKAAAAAKAAAKAAAAAQTTSPAPKESAAAASPSAPTPGRPDPITLDDLFETLGAKDVSPENRAYLTLSLSSVVHHPVVKQILANDKYHPVLMALIFALTQRDVYAGESRWETLTVIGELCRAEHRGDVHGPSAGALNDATKYFFEFFVNEPMFKTALGDILTPEASSFVDEDCRICAMDIYEALFGKVEGVSAAKRSKCGKAVEPAKEDEVKAVEGEGEEKKQVVYTKGARDRCKDLMFLDASERLLIPLVTRSSSHTCAACQKDLVDPQPIRCGHCKAVNYCSASCQNEHWKLGHKTACNNMKKLLDDYMTATMNGKRKAPASVAFPLEPTLFYETRPFLYAIRPDTLKSTGFEQYFMEYYHPTF